MTRRQRTLKVPPCSKCEDWRNPAGPREQFSLLYGMFLFDVDKARELIRERDLQAQPVLVAQLDSWCQWPRPRRSNGVLRIKLFGGAVNYEHVDHVNVAEPIIMGFVRLRPQEKRMPVLFDGRHRLVRAKRDGRRVILAYVLDGAATDAVATSRPADPRPDRRRRVVSQTAS
jgi:hypothetical protein